ncbi:4Fe-4S binding protein [Microseira sp. BLCC-F43]|jgi:ferredoxin|uniref:4Fe-4S binding protein n=1 Tax=Microseira sp. BLCC-F43 TaxID=3153602 RepID=UPI0035B7B6F5
MTYTITSSCIGCDRCLSQCPTGAISKDGDTLWINPKLCNGCAGFYRVPQCQAVCPTNKGIARLSPVSSISSGDYWDSWFNTYNQLVEKLNSKKPPTYWEKWFNSYSQELQKVIKR